MTAPKLPQRHMLAIAAAVLAAGGALAGCSSVSGSGTAGSNVGGSSNTALGYSRIDPANRVAAPPLSGTTIAGKAYSTSNRGHVTVINVWGSWCDLCREEAPSLADPDESLVLDLKSLIPTDPPTTLIVDRNGRVAVRWLGSITEPELDQGLDYALSGS